MSRTEYDRDMAILINDLDSMRHRIEALEAHPSLTVALNLVTAAKEEVTAARIELHHNDMKQRYG